MNSILILALIFALLTSGCETFEPVPRILTPAAAPSPTRLPTESLMTRSFLALGDSYTIGESVLPEERWPVQLAAALRTEGIPVEDPQIIARTGWTTGELDEGIAAADLEPPYDLVTLLIGVNNQYRGYAQEEYRIEFRALLKQAITFANGRPDQVIVLSIPDWGMTPFAELDERAPEIITTEIEAFNTINRAETTLAGAHYVDIFPISQRAYSAPNLIAGDRLHPSARQYTSWMEAVLPVALEILR